MWGWSNELSGGGRQNGEKSSDHQTALCGAGLLDVHAPIIDLAAAQELVMSTSLFAPEKRKPCEDRE